MNGIMKPYEEGRAKKTGTGQATGHLSGQYFGQN